MEFRQQTTIQSKEKQSVNRIRKPFRNAPFAKHKEGEDETLLYTH